MNLIKLMQLIYCLDGLKSESGGANANNYAACNILRQFMVKQIRKWQCASNRSRILENKLKTKNKLQK